MSEAPLITPLVPLGDFITKLGRPAGKAALHTYLMRLREQGWDVSQTVKKALHCGATLDKEVLLCNTLACTCIVLMLYCAASLHSAAISLLLDQHCMLSLNLHALRQG